MVQKSAEAHFRKRGAAFGVAESVPWLFCTSATGAVSLGSGIEKGLEARRVGRITELSLVLPKGVEDEATCSIGGDSPSPAGLLLQPASIPPALVPAAASGCQALFLHS